MVAFCLPTAGELTSLLSFLAIATFSVAADAPSKQYYICLFALLLLMLLFIAEGTWLHECVLVPLL